MGTDIRSLTRHLNLPLWYKGALAPLVPYIAVPVGLLVLHNAWIALFGYHLGMLAILLADHKQLQIRAIVRSNSYRFPLIMVLVGLAGGALLYLLWPFLNIPDGIPQYMNGLGLSQSNWIYFFIYFVAVNPWLEELYWRGYLGSSVRRPVINDLLFAGYHLVVLTGKMDIIWLAGSVFIADFRRLAVASGQPLERRLAFFGGFPCSGRFCGHAGDFFAGF